jgi:hypothetical protein
LLRHGLLRCARNDDVEAQTRQIDPTGKSLLIFRSHVKPQNRKESKIFRFRRRANQWFDSARLTRQEGRIAIVTNVRWDAVDAKVP